MLAKHIVWPSNCADGPVVAVHRPWFVSALPLGLSAAAQGFLDALLFSYDHGTLDLSTALVAEQVFLTYGWTETDTHIDSLSDLHTFWTNVYRMTRSPPA